MTSSVSGTPPAAESHPRQGTTGKLVLGALGVVLGDIGTSPLYALKESLPAIIR